MEVGEVMEKICRSCLKVDKQMKNIFVEEEGRLVVMIKECTSIKVNSNDGLPDSLCLECVEKLSAAFEFREFFKNNDQALRAHLNVTVKLDQDDEGNSLCDGNDSIQMDEAPTLESDDNYSDLEQAEQKGKFKCAQCPKFFNSPRALSSHKQKLHESEDPDFDPEMVVSKNKSYKCSDCDMKFSRQHLLLKHQREAHLEVSLHENSEIKTELQEVDENDDEDDDDDEDDEDEDELEEGSIFNTRKEYKCEYCNKVLTTKSGLRIHKRRHTGKDLYECNLCDKTFTKCSHMKRHRKEVHRTETTPDDYTKPLRNKREMQCEFCDRKFKYKKSFTQHMSVEHGIDVDEDDLIVEPVIKRRRRTILKEEKNDDSNEESDIDDEKKPPQVHICFVCNAEFNRANHLSRHMLLHRDLMTHKCDKCEEAFINEEQLTKHTMQHAERPYSCFACTKSFSRGEQYIRHVKTHEEPEHNAAILQCPICPEQSGHTGVAALTEHVKVHLASEKRHVCKTCGKAFNRADNLRTHVKSHKGEKEIPKLHLCIYCGKEFNNSSNMIVHMRRHTGERPYKCKQCGKGFPRSHDLKCHERTHSGEKPYLCTLCGKSFNKSNKLLRHTRVHTGERPYVCSICGRAFTQSNDLALHMRRHTGARPYACGVCPARFIQSGQLKAHQRSKGHWAEIAPDLKGSYRVEPVISTGESKPIRFRRTASGQKYEPPDFSEKPPPLLQEQQEQEQRQLQIAQQMNNTKDIIGTTNATNNVHLIPGQQDHQHMEEYRHTFDDYKVQSDSIQVIVPALSHTPTSTTTFHEDTTGAESSNAFSPNDGTYECRSYS